MGQGTVMGQPSRRGERGKTKKGWAAAIVAVGRGRGNEASVHFPISFPFSFSQLSILCLNAI